MRLAKNKTAANIPRPSGNKNRKLCLCQKSLGLNKFLNDEILKEAKEEINQILTKLETTNLDFANAEEAYKRLVNLNKHVENLFKMKSKEISGS